MNSGRRGSLLPWTLLAWPMAAHAHSGVPFEVVYAMIALAPLLPCLALLAIALCIVKRPRAYKCRQLGVFLASAMVLAAISYAVRGEAALIVMVLVWVVPIVACAAYEIGWRRAARR